MKEYHKIQSIFKRDEKTKKFILGQYSLPEFEYLKDNQWAWTEKVDGTNIRVDWTLEKIELGGRTDNAQIPVTLIKHIQETLPIEKFKTLYPDVAMTLYGEGYGAKIQNGGNYLSDRVSFVLFDVLIGGFWLERENVVDIASKLGIEVVPIVGQGTLAEAISKVKDGMKSTWGDFIAEGLVMRPAVEFVNRRGHRLITKVKHRDF